jgi:peptide/nickel transport system substrate-binding protein
MKRRSLLLGAGAAILARPALGGATKTITFVPQSPLASLDPIWTSAQTTRDFAFMVFDVLFGRDAQMNPKPQMLEGYTVEDDGKRWVMKLRPDLVFHDGEKVLSRDCTASLRRWLQRDPGGASLKVRLDAMEEPDDRTLVLRLNKPFPPLPKLLSKFQSPCVVVPKRIADGTDPYKQMTEIIGSGPFRFLKDEYVIGAQASMTPFEKYVPRQEPASFTSGGHKVLVDRVVWKMIPDAATAANALVTNEVDWLEMPMPDLLPMLKAAPNVRTGRLDDLGLISQLRPNHLIAPTSNVKLRRAIMAAINQKEVMQAVMGDDSENYSVPQGFMVTGKPEVDQAGIEAVSRRHTPDELKKMLADAGYQGEKLVLLHTSDQPFYNSASEVVADQLHRAGMNVDDQVMDWGTVLQRRASKKPLDQGGWSLFVSVTPVPEYRDPLVATLLRGNGEHAWIGWPTIPEIEKDYFAWLDADNEAERTRLERDIELTAFDQVPFVPLGRYMPRVAWSTAITTPGKGPAPTFWNVSKT